ncbi:MAG: Processive diacylglycerol beta-glucosyltransferase [Dehalococcoidia bacterium]|nr:Processive diacylglycerol beta-glucosyltransferase [Bacillota bacterium]
MIPLADVLLLTATFGGGHIHACMAVEHAFKRFFPEVKVASFDFFKEISPWLAESANSLYLAAIRFRPELYGSFYNYANRLPHDSSLQKGLNLIGLNKCAKLLWAIQPQVVVSFYPAPSQVVGDLKGKGQFYGQLVTVITDYIVNNQWIHPLTDLYLVAAIEVKNELTACGVPGDKIKVTGIPISLDFAQEKNRNELLKNNGLDQSLPLLLICCGAFGVNRGIEELCREVASYKASLQSVVISGRNSRLQQRLAPIAHGANHPFYVSGYVKNMADWMAMAEIVVSKSGGLTVSEAIASDLPMVIIPPFPGQETANARYLQNRGAAVLCEDISHIPQVIFHLLKNPLELQKMRCSAREIKKPFAAKHATAVITGMLSGIHAKRQA